MCRPCCLAAAFTSQLFHYLRVYRSIPAFLAAVTLDCYERSTLSNTVMADLAALTREEGPSASSSSASSGGAPGSFVGNLAARGRGGSLNWETDEEG